MRSETCRTDLRHMSEVDRLIHEPARLVILAVLNVVEKSDFLFLLRETGLTRGNLSVHLSKLDSAGYVQIEKTFRGKIPQTLVSLTPVGRGAFHQYRKQLGDIVQTLSKDLPDE